MGDHLDFRNSVIQGPFVGKSVTQAVVSTPLIPTEVFVILRTNYYYEGNETNVLGVSLSKSDANDFVRKYTVPDSTLTAHERGHDDLFYRHFQVHEGDIDDVAVYIEVTKML